MVNFQSVTLSVGCKDGFAASMNLHGIGSALTSHCFIPQTLKAKKLKQPNCSLKCTV